MNRDSFDILLGAGVGRKKKENKTSFLNSKRKEREDRELMRLKEKNALVIQAFYRGFCVKQQVIRNFEQEILKKCEDLNKLLKMFESQKSKLITILSKVLRTQQIFTGVFIFYNKKSAKSHQQIIEQISAYLATLLSELPNTPDHDDILSILTGGDQSKDKWAMFKFKKIFTLLMHLNFVNGQINSPNFSHICLEWIKAILPEKDSDNRMQIETSGSRNVRSKADLFYTFMNGLSEDIVKHAINYAISFENPIYREFVFELVSHNPKISSRTIFNKMTDLQIVPKALETLQEKSRAPFMNSYLKMGLVANKATDEIENLQTRIMNFLANINESQSILIKLPSSSVLDIFNVMLVLVTEFEDAAVSKLGPQSGFINEVEFEEEKAPPLILNSKSEGKERSLVKIARDQVRLDANYDTIQSLSALFSAALIQLSKDSNSSSAVSSLCVSILKFRSWLASSQKGYIDNILAFKFSIHIQLFTTIYETNFIQDYFINNTEKWSPILYLFCRVFHKKLLITDDEEFIGNKEIITEFEQKNNIEISKIILFSKFLNELVFLLVWKRLSKLYPIKGAAVKLLKELYNRDSRLKFTKDSAFWNVPMLSNAAGDLATDQTKLKRDLINDILVHVPHMINFENRLRIFHYLVEMDKTRQDRFPYYSDSEGEGHDESNAKVLRIRRQYLLEDSYDLLSRRKNMKSLFTIKFINEHNMEEEGIDGGGLLKEFVSQLSRIAFDIEYGLFEEKEDQTLSPNAHSYLVEDHLKLFNFLGRVVGKAIYENILIEPMFSVIFLNRILRIPNTINELKYSDQMLYKSLLQLKHKEGIADSLGLNFSVTDNAMGVTRMIDLKEGGDRIEVNEANKLEYIALLCKFKLNTQIDAQSQAFGDGLKKVIDTTWVQMFNHEELQLVLCGSRKQGFDVKDLKENVHCSDFGEKSQTLKDFWEVLEELSDEDKNLFLHFTTGCSRPPTFGFKYMQPKFAIKKASFGEDDQTELLPSSSTCMNLLKLPNYKNKEKLRAKLLYAIRSNSGFEMG